MLPLLARSYDRFLGAILGRLIARPPKNLARPAWVPGRPEDIPVSGPVIPKFEEKTAGRFTFQAPRLQDAPWSDPSSIVGRALQPTTGKAAVFVLHGAHETDYGYCERMGQTFAKNGYRVLIPAAPSHLERGPKEMLSGTEMFWSSEHVVAGLGQWLAEIHALMAGLRQEGVERIGVLGFSLGTLAAGLAGTLWKDLDFVALLAPVGHHLEAIGKSSVARGIWPWMRNLDADGCELLDRWAPRYRQPVVERLLFLMTLFDQIQPTPLQEAWWQAWGRPPYRTYRHGHISVLFSRQLYRDLEEFAEKKGELPA